MTNPRTHNRSGSYITMALMIALFMLTPFAMVHHSPPPKPEITEFINDPPRSKPAPRPVVRVQYVKSPTLNVYSGPDITGQLTNKLSIRDRVIVLADSGDWKMVASTNPIDTGYVNSQSLTETPPPQLEISEWRWQKDDTLGTKGAIVYEGSIENNTHETKNFVKLKLITYDMQKKFVGSDDIYLPENIPPFGRVQFKGSAKARGNEHDAVVRVAIQ